MWYFGLFFVFLGLGVLLYSGCKETETPVTTKQPVEGVQHPSHKVKLVPRKGPGPLRADEQ